MLSASYINVCMASQRNNTDSFLHLQDGNGNKNEQQTVDPPELSTSDAVRTNPHNAQPYAPPMNNISAIGTTASYSPQCNRNNNSSNVPCDGVNTNPNNVQSGSTIAIANNWLINGFEINAILVQRCIQLQDTHVFAPLFKLMDVILESQANPEMKYNLLFGDFMFTRSDHPFYNKYSILDFMTFFYCKHHSQIILNNFNNYTVSCMNNLLTNMKIYNLQHGYKFVIPFKIYYKCLQLHYNQISKKTNNSNSKKSMIFARIFNLLVINDGNSDELNPSNNGGDYKEWFKLIILMSNCLAENKKDLTHGCALAMFHKNCQFVSYKIQCRYPQVIYSYLYWCLNKENINNLVDEINDMALASDQRYYIILQLVDSFIENSKNDAISNGSWKKKLIDSYTRTIVNTKAVNDQMTGKRFDRGLSDELLSRIYTFGDDDIDKYPVLFDTLCHWWINLCNKHAKNGIDLSLFQLSSVDYIFPTPKVLKALFNKWMSVDKQVIQDGQTTYHKALPDDCVISRVWNHNDWISNKGVSVIDDNDFGDPLNVDRLLVHCLSSLFEDFMFDEELNLLRGLNMFVRLGVPIDVIRLIVQYKHSIVCQEVIKKEKNFGMVTGLCDANDTLCPSSLPMKWEYELFGSKFYFMPKLLNWDLIGINHTLKKTIHNNNDKYTLNQWKLYFQDRFRPYVCCSYSNTDINYQTTLIDKLFDRVGDQVAMLHAQQ